MWDALQHGRRSGAASVERLRGLAPFRDLSQPALTLLAQRSRWRVYRPGEEVVAAGALDRTVHVVLDGVVCVGGVAPDGREIVAFFLGPGDVIDVVDLPDVLLEVTFARPLMAEATVVSVPAEPFRQVEEMHLSLKAELLDQTRRRLYEMATLLMDCMFGDAVIRYGHLLGKLGPLYPDQFLTVSHDEIARLSGMSRSRLELVLPRLKKAGYVDYQFGEPGIRILDVDSLVHIENTLGSM